MDMVVPVRSVRHFIGEKGCNGICGWGTECILRRTTWWVTAERRSLRILDAMHNALSVGVSVALGRTRVNIK